MWHSLHSADDKSVDNVGIRSRMSLKLKWDQWLSVDGGNIMSRFGYLCLDRYTFLEMGSSISFILNANITRTEVVAWSMQAGICYPNSLKRRCLVDDFNVLSNECLKSLEPLRRLFQERWNFSCVVSVSHNGDYERMKSFSPLKMDRASFSESFANICQFNP